MWSQTSGVAALDARSRAYAAARRHSVRVRFLKLSIPVGAAAAIALVVSVAMFDPLGGAGIGIGSLRFAGTKITMDNPRLTGFRKDSRSYEVTATTAMQDVRKPTLIELSDMKGRLATDDRGGTAWLESDFGVFDSQNERLQLRQNVKVWTHQGEKAFLSSAAVDFKAGTVVTSEPIRIVLANGTVEADSMNLSDSGKVIAFVGRVRTVFETADTEAARPKRVAGAEALASAEAAPSPSEPAAVAPTAGARP